MKSEFSNLKWPAELEEKMSALCDLLKEMKSVVVAYSGGVDSTFLAAVAHQVLGERSLAVTAVSPSLPESERLEADRLAQQMNLQHRTIESCEFSNQKFTSNPPDRCYHCKSELFTKLLSIAKANHFSVVVDGANADDTSDYRPGSEAARELGVRSPLQEARFTKKDIRQASAIMHIPTASKPASACLASRIPYGTEITAQILRAVEKAEESLHNLGFTSVRVRVHGDVARIELQPSEVDAMLDSERRARIVAKVKEAGFRYVTLDLEGYRTGSMNEGLRANIEH